MQVPIGILHQLWPYR